MAEQEWEQLQSFVAAAEEGSFTKAASRLGVSQPTVSRRIDELERDLGVELFIRHSRGLKLTDRGASLFDSAQGLSSQVREMFRRVQRRRLSPEGTVRISVNEPLGVHVLPPTFEKIMRKHKKLQLEVVVDNSATDLSKRDADLAVRMFEPTQGDLIAKKIGHIDIALYASPLFLKKRKLPDEFDPRRVPTVGMDADPSWPRLLKEIGLKHADFPFRTDSLLLQLSAAVAGVAVVGTHPQIAERLGLRRVYPDVTLHGYELWVVRHASLRNDLAVRIVAEEIEEALRDYVHPPSPEPLSSSSTRILHRQQKP